VAEGLGLGSYRYGGAPQRKKEDGGRPGRFTVVGGRAPDLRTAQASVDATCRARDWVNRPPRDLTPRHFARLIEQAAASAGLACEIWDEDRIADERLGALMGVAAGADEPPRLIRLEHRRPGGRPPSTWSAKGLPSTRGACP
jgi:leucyl aminopeptidase